MTEPSKDFMEMVDVLVDFADHDQELKTSIGWLDKTKVYGADLNFYEKVQEIVRRSDVRKKAEEWNKERENK